ncbi:uncharacterized protein LOC119407307 [Rhipicephalus sanguineus]|nr:uncharacterized protein LOC119407307 [Rhipicephalus sanguineus]XP_037530147.1 uncharacterized protein LOC119407307 [Rhipicephalus sanguineus]
MPDTTYLLCGFASGLDWRPIGFKQRLQTTRVCRLCGVVPQSIAVLPCTHFLCDSCLNGCADEEGLHACPLDKTSFDAESDVSWITFNRKQVERLLVSCWNAKYGCDFTGPAGELLEHFEKHCSFHAIACSRCRDTVLRKDLLRHCEAGCNGVASLQPTTAGHVSAANAGAPTTTAYSRGRDLVADCSCHDMLSSIQGRVNDLAEALDKLGSKRVSEQTTCDSASTSRGVSGFEATASVQETTPGTTSLGALVSALNEMKLVVTEGFRKIERRARSENLPGCSSSSMQQSRPQAAVASRPSRSAPVYPPSALPLELPRSSGGPGYLTTSEGTEELFVFSVQYKPWLTAEKSQGLKVVWHPIYIGREETGVCIRCVVQRNASFVAVYAMCTMPARWKLPEVRPLRAEDLSSPNLREWIVEKAKEPSRDYLPVSAYAPDLRLRCMLDATSLAPKNIVEGEIQVDFLVKLERHFPVT